MSKGRLHRPHTAQAKSSAQVSKMPPNARGQYRRKPKPRHPQCNTTKALWGMIVRWQREGLTADLVRTKYGDSEDATVQAAVFNFCKLLEKGQ